MNLFLVENDQTIGQILQLPHFDSQRDVVVCFNYLPLLKLRASQIHCRHYFIEDLFSAASYADLHAATDRFAAGWYRPGQRDETLYRDISFGKVSEITIARDYLINILVKYGEAIRTAIERHPQISRIHHDFSNASNCIYLWLDDRGRFFNKLLLLDSIARQKHLQLSAIPGVRPIPPRLTGTIRRFFGPPASFGGRLRRWLRLLALYTLNVINTLRYGRETETIYFFNYFNLASVVHHARRGLLVPSPRRGSLTAPVHYVDFLNQRYKSTAEDTSFLQHLKEVFFPAGRFVGGTEFIYNEINYGCVYEPIIRHLIEVRIPDLVRYSQQVESAITSFNIRAVVDMDLMSEMGKTRAETCRKHGVKIIFVDHGIMGLRMVQRASHASTPDLIIKPDAFDLSKDPYPYDMKAPTLVLGNPCTDPYPVTKRKRVKSIRKVLLATFADNFYGRLDRYAYQELYFKELLSAIGPISASGIEIHYRPHSENDEYHDYLFDFFGVDSSALHFSKWSTPFSKLIYDMDLLVCSISNVFYEAQAAGVPTLFLDPHFIPEAMFPPFNGENWEDVIRVATGKELVDIILRNRTDPSELNRFLDRFLENRSERYMYKLDGRAGERIARYLFEENH